MIRHSPCSLAPRTTRVVTRKAYIMQFPSHLRYNMKAVAVLILASVVLAGISESYYDILGVPRTANDDQIKKAFKKLSLKYHPDRNVNDRENAQKVFSKIATAYDVLSDAGKRKVYDQRGEAGVSDFEQQKANEKNYQEMYGQYWKPRKQVYESLYTNTDVLELEMDNISKLFRRNLIWIVNFYHPNCGHCVSYKPDYISIAQKLAGIIVLAAVNCSSDEELCEEYGIQSYPTLIYFPENTAAVHEEFKGDRTLSGILDFTVPRMQSFVRLVHKDNFQDFIDTNSNLLKVLLFTSRKSTPPIFKILSKEFKEKCVIGEVRSTDADLTARFNVTDFPTIMALTSLDYPEVYTGEGKIELIDAWLRSFAGKTFEKPLVRELTRNLQKHGHCNRQDPNLCVVLFSDSYSDITVFQLKEVARHFQRDKISFFWVNKQKYREFYEGFGEVKGVVFKAKKLKFMSFDDVEGLKETLPNVLSGGGTFEKMLMPPELNEVKTEL